MTAPRHPPCLMTGHIHNTQGRVTAASGHRTGKMTSLGLKQYKSIACHGYSRGQGDDKKPLPPRPKTAGLLLQRRKNGVRNQVTLENEKLQSVGKAWE